jgi:hypothetical protein
MNKFEINYYKSLNKVACPTVSAKIGKDLKLKTLSAI